MQRLSIALLFSCAVIAQLSAQGARTGDQSKFELFAGYSANGYFVEESSVSGAGPNVSSLFTDRAGGPGGFEVSLSREIRNRFSLKGDVSMHLEPLDGHTGAICQSQVCPAGQAFSVP